MKKPVSKIISVRLSEPYLTCLRKLASASRDKPGTTARKLLEDSLDQQPLPPRKKGLVRA